MYKEKLKRWMKELAPYRREPGKIKLSETALLVIDMENYFASPSGNSFLSETKYIVPNIKKVISFFRKHKAPVIFTAHQHLNINIDGGMLAKWWGGYIQEGTDQAEICEELKPKKGEKVIKKRRYSAFFQTDLELVLKSMATKNLIITGVMTNLCCETTARDAFMRDYNVFFLADGNCSTSEEMHLASLKNLAFGFAHVLTCDDVIKLMK